MSASAASAGAAGSVRAAVNLLAIAALFSGAALRICDGLLPRLAADFGISTGTAGRAVLTFATAYGFAQLAYGPLADRYGKAKLVCSALFGCALAGLACAFAPGFDALVLLRIVWGVAAAGVIPLAMAWIGDTVPYEQRQATLARLLTGTLTGMMLGQLGGGLFADSTFGWRGAFLTLAAGYALVALLLLRKLRTLTALSPAAGSGRVGFLSQLTTVFGVPWVRVVLATVAAEGVFLLGPLSFLPAYLHQRFGLSVSAASALIALYAVGGLVYAMTARTIVRRFGERKMVLAGGLLMAAGFLAWYASPVAWLAAPVALLVGFGTYLFHNTLQTNATQMAPAARGTAMALFASSFFIGQAVGVSWAGAAFDRFGPAPLLLVPALALGLAGWGFARALRRRAAE
ncbi:MAG TPA: MFS transporter [Ramlibacter sp.]|nr:MFS transporter [Ramlibacter sp.]